MKREGFFLRSGRTTRGENSGEEGTQRYKQSRIKNSGDKGMECLWGFHIWGMVNQD